MKRQKTRRIRIAAVILSISLSACSGNTNSEESYVSVDTEQQTTTVESNTDSSQPEGDQTMITLTVNGSTLKAQLAENSSAEALKEMLINGPLTVEMSDYANMEKVGSLGKRLPTNDERITTEAGDIILYQGSQFVIYYAPNTWSLTRLGKIQNVTASELYEILGDGDVEVTLSLTEE